MRFSVWKKGEKKKKFYLRLDDRLIHGQVVQGWVPFLSIDEIFVVSDRISSDPMQQKIMSLSVPPDVSLHFIDTSRIPSISDVSNGKNVLILVNNVDDLVKVASLVPVEFVNVGNYHKRGENVVNLTSFFTCSLEELEKLKILSREGKKVELRNIPGEKGKEIIDD